MTKLKPCPFCGGEAKITEESDCSSSIFFVARCQKCLVDVRIGAEMTKSIAFNREKVTEAWNKRPNPWHTGIPTEEGWYLCKVIGLAVDDEDKFIPYYILEYKNNEFRTKITGFVVPKEHIAKWQKIDEYKEMER